MDDGEEEKDQTRPEQTDATDSSLSLSLTPPIVEDNQVNNDNKDVQENVSEGSVSEHLTSNSGSAENDRSFQEIEVTSAPYFLTNLSSVENVSQEQRPESLNNSFLSENSIISLNALERFADRNDQSSGIKSILDEILNNDLFQSDNDDHTVSNSIDIFRNLNLDDNSLINRSKNDNSILNGRNYYDDLNLEVTPLLRNQSDVEKRVKDLEEMLVVKDTMIAALNSELESMKEISNSNTLSMVSATEYKQLQEEFHTKLLECNSVVMYKNDLIQQLSEALDQSVNERKELMAQVESLKSDTAQLQQKLQETSEMLNEYTCDNKTENEDMEKDKPDAELVKQLKSEVNDLKAKIKTDKSEYESEVKRLRDLLASIKCGSTEIMDFKSELETKHTQEMEELRTYFEKKCAELEKNYSEEIFSQHSRKLSGASSDADLNSEALFSNNQPGPGGDNLEILNEISKNDVTKLKDELTSILNTINNHDIENLDDEEFNNLKSELGKFDLRNLFRIEESNKLKEVEDNYVEEINNLKNQLQEAEKANKMIICANQEVASSGDSEITDIIQSYERRLQEQVTLAKIDLISALECQIQRLVSNEADDEEWPSELLILRDRFTDKYEMKIHEMKEEHEQEIERLKEEHLKTLNSSLERARRRSLIDNDSLSKGQEELLKERDILKKQVVSLRNLLSELLKYFTQCEDELNNTLVDELLKQGFDKTQVAQPDEETNLNESSATNSSSSFPNITRVHLTPNFGDLISMLESKTEDDDKNDISVELRNELGKCLDTLRQEANAILALTSNIPKPQNTNDPGNKSVNLEEKLSSLMRQLISETQMKERLKIDLQEAVCLVESLEKEKDNLDSQLNDALQKIDTLEKKLNDARMKIAELIESGHKEIVSEGYGQNGHSALQEDTLSLLSNLQEKARNMLAQSRASANPEMLHLMEELCRVSEKIKDEHKKDRADLLQQIEAADKKYKITQKFLEEQAVEREQERDDWLKKIEKLQEQLRGRDKDRANCEIITSEDNGVCNVLNMQLFYQLVQKAENLEKQLEDMTKILAEESRRFKEIDSERIEAIEKIKILRDIIRELEVQNEKKEKDLQDCMQTIEKLECIIDEQHRSIEELKHFDSVHNVSDVQELRKHIEALEGELGQLRINSELAGKEGALRQLKLQLLQFENTLDKKTKELEALHSSGTNSCSSPSEDMSVRDMVRSQNQDVPLDDCDVPLQQLARLKEKLIRHNRAEDAAMKRIKDLEMHVFTVKSELEETENEKEYMKRQIEEQLVLISDLQIRLDQQRIRAEHIEKQTNTSLESRIYDLQNEIANLHEKLKTKDKFINHQQVLIEETQKRLKDMELEMTSSKDDEMLVAMQKELEELRREHTHLKEKIAKEANIVPNIVDNIISDKNNDIEKLRERLAETEKALDSYVALSLDQQDLQALANLKNLGTSIQDVITIFETSQPDQMRKAPSRNETLSDTNLSLKRIPSDTLFEISEIEKVGPSNIHYTMQAPLLKPNSTEVFRSAEKKVHFEDTEIEKLKSEVENKNEVIVEYEERLKALADLEQKISNLQNCLDQTEKQLILATETFKKEQEELSEREKKVSVELAEKKLRLSELEKKIQLLENDNKRKDDMCLKIAKEKRDLERDIVAIKKDSFDNLDSLINEKNYEINEYKRELELKDEEIASLKEQIDMESEKLNEVSALKETIFDLKDKVKHKSEEVKSLEKECREKNAVINAMNAEEDKYKALLIDKDCEIEILNEDAKRYQNDIDELEEKLKSASNRNIESEIVKLKNDIAEKDDTMKKMNKEIAHLQDLVAEKDKIINQMSEDNKKIHTNLVTIQNKMRETGNIIDLANKLREKQKENAELLQEIHNLKAKLLTYEGTNMVTSVDEITGQLKKELDYAAEIDSNIISAISDQSLSSISETQDVEMLRKVINKTKNQNRKLMQINDHLLKEKQKLDQNCGILQGKVESLQNILEKERIALQKTQLEDAKLIEQLRIKLDAAMDAEEEFGRMLQEEKISKQNAEIELNELRKRTEKSLSSESTKYHQPPSKEALELRVVKEDLERLKKENEKLSSEIRTLNKAKQELENSAKYTKDMLLLENERNKKLEDKVHGLIENEKELTAELLLKKMQLDEKIKDIEKFKILRDEWEEEKAHLKKQKEELLERLKAQIESDVHPNMNSFISDTLHEKIKELNRKVKESARIMEMLEKEKRDLELQLMEAKHKINVPITDLVARADFLFAKNLKLESVRKSLIWQKRYLLDYLESHQKNCLVEALPKLPHQRFLYRLQRSPMEKFRTIVTVIIAIQRMKFIARKWHNSLQLAHRVNARHYQHIDHHDHNQGINFQVGQPVSNQHFAYNVTLNRPLPTNPFVRVLTDDEATNYEEVRNEEPWSGMSPPSRERGSRIRIGPEPPRQLEEITPLTAPQRIAQFVERFDQLQEKINVAISSSNSAQ